MDKTKAQFNKILQEFKKDPDVIGAFLSGSRGKGFEHQDSDYDLYVIVKDSRVLGKILMYGEICFYGKLTIICSVNDAL